MVKSGTVHILVVSGFNVGIVSFLVVLLLKILRIRGKARLCLAALSLVIYCLACGASTPVVRATVMGIFFLAAFFCKREPDIYNSLAVAAILIMLVSPRQLFDVGFQLSFASVISIVYIYPKIKTFLRLERLKSKPLAFLADGCLVSFSAWLGTCGIIAANFRIFSPVTVLANIFIVPLATLITLCSFSLVLVGLALPPLAPFFGRSAELAVGGLLLVNGLLIKLPGAYFYLP
jgi:competence protein ComEC